MGFLQGKRALVAGLASRRSIAWGIACAMRREGAELAFTYRNDKLRERVGTMAGELGSTLVLPCDVTDDAQITGLFEKLGHHWDRLDIVVHSIAFAPRGQLDAQYLDAVTREGFHVAVDVSAYSFAAMAKAARPMLQPGGALLTLSYLGAERAVPHYNVMGVAKAALEANVRYLAADLGPEQIRVNAISAGPIKTPAAKGIGDFNQLLDYGRKHSPLRRNVTIEEVGNAAAFLCSDLASGITGEIMYVDAGFNIMAVGVPEFMTGR